MEMRGDWTEIELEKLSSYVIGGDWGKDENFDDPEYEHAYCIRGAEFRNWPLEKGRTASLRKIKRSNLEKRKLKFGDILIEISGGGPDQPVGRTVLIDNTVLHQLRSHPIVCTNFLRLFRPSNSEISNWLNTYLEFFYRAGRTIAYQGGSNNLRNLKFKQFQTIKIPFAPLTEQRAIVSKIEQLFSELDHGIANLKAAKTKLEIYRQAVLKKAFEGELTKEWRKNQNRNLKLAAEPLAEYKHVEQSQAKKNGSNDLPEGWEWVKLGEVIEKPKYGTSKKCTYDQNGIGVLRIPNIGKGVVDDTDMKYASFNSEELKVFELNPGDLLTIRSNGSVDLVGKCAIIRNQDQSYLFAGYLIRLRPMPNRINSKYLLYCMQSQLLRVQIESKAKSTSGVNNINSGELQSLIIPWPSSIDEQTQIVQEIESRLSVCDKLSESIDQSLEQATALRQSILKKAFAGELLRAKELDACKKEPDWEPAEKLVERVKNLNS